MKANELVRRILYPRANPDENRMSKAFANSWVVVTGASRGIGEALVRRLIASHANLFLIARDEAKLQALCAEAREAGCEARYSALDLRDRERLDQLCRQLRETTSRVDYLFCNAGKSIHRDILDAQDRMHDFDRTMDLNYRAHVALTLALLPQLSESRGHILYTSSVSTLYPPAPGWSAYHASKCAANTWYETARTEWKRRGICVQVAYLPLVHTGMSDVNPAYRNLPGYSADEAACQLIGLCLTRRFSYKPWWARLSTPVATLFSPIVKLFY